MKHPHPSRAVLCALIGAGLLALAPPPTNAFIPVEETATAPAAQPGLSLDLPAGSVLRFTLPDRRIGREGRQARKLYDRHVRRFLERIGQHDHGALEVRGTVLGGGQPEALELSSFAGREALRRAEAHPDWAAVRKQRSRGWSKAETFSTTLPADLALHFDPAKSYTLAIAWTNPAHPDSYARYLDGIEADFERVGARYLHSFTGIDHENADGRVPPARMVLVEWDDADGLDALLSGEVYRANRQFFARGVSDFRLYRLRAPHG